MKKLLLSTNDQVKLSNMSETGMGYHMVDIILNNGLELYNRIVLNSSYLVLEDYESISAGDIKKLKAHD